MIKQRCYNTYIIPNKGMSQLNFYVNKAPINGKCSLMNNATKNPRCHHSEVNIYSLLFPLHFSTFTSLVEEVEFICEDWMDPESIGIKSYLLFSTDVTTNVKNSIQRTNNLYSHQILSIGCIPTSKGDTIQSKCCIYISSWARKFFFPC